MNCLNEIEIQKYLDRELPEEMLNGVEQHLKLCSACKDTYSQALESKSQVFAFLDQFAAFDTPREIPVFKPGLKKRSLKKIVAITSIAASILLFIGFGIKINNQKTTQKQIDNITKATYEVTRNIDPNKMAHDKQIIVVTTNSSGEVIETTITE
ncbi:MAG: zf-HC2 domain-containing protein [Lentimicrobiaceae bacterium]|jgi:hypothetical protein